MTAPIRTDHRHDDSGALYVCIILVAIALAAIVIVEGYQARALEARVAAIEARQEVAK